MALTHHLYYDRRLVLSGARERVLDAALERGWIDLQAHGDQTIPVILDRRASVTLARSAAPQARDHMRALREDFSDFMDAD